LSSIFSQIWHICILSTIAASVCSKSPAHGVITDEKSDKLATSLVVSVDIQATDITLRVIYYTVGLIEGTTLYYRKAVAVDFQLFVIDTVYVKQTLFAAFTLPINTLLSVMDTHNIFYLNSL
jgi:hypothetical protein